MRKYFDCLITDFVNNLQMTYLQHGHCSLIGGSIIKRETQENKTDLSQNCINGEGFRKYCTYDARLPNCFFKNYT
jgi:hypothetical protein